MQHVLQSIEGWSTIRQYKDSAPRCRASRRSSVSSTDASEYSTFSQASAASSATSASAASSVSLHDAASLLPNSASSFSCGSQNTLNSVQQSDFADLQCQSTSFRTSEAPLSEKFLESLDLGVSTGTSYIVNRPSGLTGNSLCAQNPTPYEGSSSIPSSSCSSQPLPPIVRAQQNSRRSCTFRNWCKPTLVRQEDRRLDFVEHLVDSATQLVALIWPDSTAPSPCKNRKTGNGVIPLRIFIRETLRRSRTSYSTLQVTLYYLVLIKNKGALPERPPRSDSSPACPTLRALQCGRRMFLAGLILASKYLQDRNFSARAWSKISGLPVKEINFNEMTFLDAIGWKLYIKLSDFNEWSGKVSECTDAAQRGLDCPWTDVLNNEFLISDKACSALNSPVSPLEKAKMPFNFDICDAVANAGNTASMSAPTSRRTSWVPRQPSIDGASSLGSQGSTPTTLEPQCYVAPAAPSNLGRNLCTPQFTPSSAGSNLSTPAESAHAHFPAYTPVLANTFPARTNCVSWLSRRSSTSSRSFQCPILSRCSGASQRSTYPTISATTAQTSRLQDMCLENTPSLVTSPRSIASSEDQNSVTSGSIEPLDVLAGYPSPPTSESGPISPTRSETSRIYLRLADGSVPITKANFLPPPLPPLRSSRQPSQLGSTMQRTSSTSSSSTTTTSTSTTPSCSGTWSYSNTPTPTSLSASSQPRGLKRRSDQDYLTVASGKKLARTAVHD